MELDNSKEFMKIVKKLEKINRTIDYITMSNDKTYQNGWIDEKFHDVVRKICIHQQTEIEHIIELLKFDITLLDDLKEAEENEMERTLNKLD